MDISTLQLSQHLKKNGYSLTKSRITVYRALENKEALSMAELVRACQGSLDRATVYRSVALFESLGIVERLNIGWKYKLELSGSFSHHHHHLTCLGCNQVIALTEDDQLEERLAGLAKAHRFTPENHQIEIRGWCQNCHAQKTAQAS